MATTCYQYVLFEKIKFGFSVFFRCFSCFRNIYERFQFLFGMVQTCSDAIPYILCPYCGDKVYCLEDEPGTYQLLFETYQDPLSTLTFQIMGNSGEPYTIIWGDNTLSTSNFDGTLQSFVHDYSLTGTYYVKILVDPLQILQFKINTQPLSGSLPSFIDFFNITNISFRYANLSGSLPAINSLQYLTNYEVDYNSFSGSPPDLSGMASLLYYVVRNNSLTGNLSDPDSCSVLNRYVANTNQLTGSLPNISAAPSLERFVAYENNFTGNIPAFTSNPNLVFFQVYSNALSGTIPSLSLLYKLQNFRCESNLLTAYTASVIALTCVNFRLNDNLLPESSVDQILSDFNDNLASRPVSGTLNLGGTGNAPPSAAGLVFKANIIAHGWTVTTN